MSQIQADVVSISEYDGIHIVKFKHEEQTLAMMSLSLTDLKISDRVILNIKSSHVGIAKNPAGEFSFSNKIRAKIKDLNIGKLLCVTKLQISENSYIESILTADSAKRMSLKIDDEVFAFFKASEISIAKILT